LTLTNSLIPIKFKNETFEAVFLRKHVIIGAGAVVFPGVDIAEGCAVGAMSVVKRSTEPWGVYVGNPARRVKERKRNMLELEKEFLKEGTS
jgi:acetyltransferase-like isoleucine patch superfamily enzyme